MAEIEIFIFRAWPLNPAETWDVLSGTYQHKFLIYENRHHLTDLRNQTRLENFALKSQKSASIVAYQNRIVSGTLLRLKISHLVYSFRWVYIKLIFLVIDFFITKLKSTSRRGWKSWKFITLINIRLTDKADWVIKWRSCWNISNYFLISQEWVNLAGRRQYPYSHQLSGTLWSREGTLAYLGRGFVLRVFWDTSAVDTKVEHPRQCKNFTQHSDNVFSTICSKLRN